MGISGSARCSEREYPSTLIGARTDQQSIAYLSYDTVRLDSKGETVPDRVHSDVAKKGQGGPSVSVRDVLDKKDGKEVWVVIKGEVYKYIPFLLYKPSLQADQAA